MQGFAGALESVQADVVRLAGGRATDGSIKTWSWAGALMRRVRGRCGTEARFGKAQPELAVQARVKLSWRGVFDG